MTYSKRLSNVSVLGAAGKMGSGILLLMAQELFALSRDPGNSGLEFRLNAIDISEEGLKGILKYIEKQAGRVAAKKPDSVRGFFDSSMPEEELAEAYAKGVLGLISPSTELSAAYGSGLVFEAASEDKDLKVKLLADINSNSSAEPWFFTNTSSIPISYIDDAASLGGRVLGYHFYNPPAVQKLVELITTSGTKSELRELALELAGRIRKIIVPSNDVAGFIGNGHFMRDALYGILKAEELSPELGFVNAVYAVNTVSQNFLVRPMGIFQLCDYVGLDVVQFIMKVMDPYMEGEELHSNLLDSFVSAGVKGGQNPDGSQKNGFLSYEAGRIIGIYDPVEGEYVDIGSIKTVADQWLGAMPENYKSWKMVIAAGDKDAVLSDFFTTLKGHGTKGAALAMEYGSNSKAIAQKLVSDGVANSGDDVNKVLFTGFFHAYGAINEYFD